MSKIIIFIILVLSLQTHSYAHSSHTNLVYGGEDLPLEVSTQYVLPKNQTLKDKCNNGKGQACVALGTLYYTGDDEGNRYRLRFYRRFCQLSQINRRRRGSFPHP